MANLRTETEHLGRLEGAIAALQAGQCVLLYDADGREEETDMVVATQFATPETIRRMRQAAGGLICATVPPQTHERLALPYLVDVLSESAARHPILGELTRAQVPYERGAGSKPSFTVSINHRHTFTGITDQDRSLTLRALADLVAATPTSTTAELQDHFVKSFKAPGHVFLLNARPGLLRERQGHTELSTALMQLAGLVPSATICEMMADDGRALSKADAIKYAGQNGHVFLEGNEVLGAWNKATSSAKRTP